MAAAGGPNRTVRSSTAYSRGCDGDWSTEGISQATATVITPLEQAEAFVAATRTQRGTAMSKERGSEFRDERCGPTPKNPATAQASGALTANGPSPAPRFAKARHARAQKRLF